MKQHLERTLEDEAFAELEKRMKPRVIDDDDTMCYRNDVIEEVATRIEQFSIPFGHSTVDSFAAFVRGMKR
jgi:hypothetical protein